MSGCNQLSNNSSTNNNPLFSDRNKFIGTWARTSYDFGAQGINLSVTFFSDGTITESTWIDFNYGQNWELKDGMLTIIIGGSVLQAWNYAFSNSDRTLTLTKSDNSKTIVYTKQL